MNKIQYLLTKIAEEASEISQIALKIQQFGLYEVCPDLDETNVERINKEFNDLLGVVELFNFEVYQITGRSDELKRDEYLIQHKKEKIGKYYNYSVELGQVKEDSL